MMVNSRAIEFAPAISADIMRSAGIVLQPHNMQYIKEVFLLKNKTYSGG